MGERRRRRLRGRHLEPARPHDGARRGSRRYRAEDEPDGRLREHDQPATGLQPGPRALRVHRGTLGQGGRAPVPLLAAQERHRRRVEPVRRSVPADGARVRSAVRKILERPVQGLPRQGTASRLRAGSVARSRQNELRQRLLNRAVALRRSHRGGDRQPARSGDGHRAGVVERRRRRPEPHEGVR